MPKLEKTIAISLQAAAGVLFVAAGAGARVDDVQLFLFGIPAIASGIGGLMLWGRAAVAPVAPVKEIPSPATEIMQLQETLSSLQNEVMQVRQDREFFQELYAGRK
jgi:hypothetical protein